MNGKVLLSLFMSYVTTMTMVSSTEDFKSSEEKGHFLEEAGWTLARIGMVATAGAAVAFTMIDGYDEQKLNEKVQDELEYFHDPSCYLKTTNFCWRD